MILETLKVGNPFQNYNRVKNGGRKNNRETKNDVIGQQVEAETGQHDEWRHWMYKPGQDQRRR